MSPVAESRKAFVVDAHSSVNGKLIYLDDLATPMPGVSAYVALSYVCWSRAKSIDDSIGVSSQETLAAFLAPSDFAPIPSPAPSPPPPGPSLVAESSKSSFESGILLSAVERLKIKLAFCIVSICFTYSENRCQFF